MDEIKKYNLGDISVAIVDDHEVVLEGLRSFIVKNGITHVEAFSKAKPLLDRIPSHPFDVYILDVELTDMEATDMIDQLRAIQPGAKILINTVHEDPWTVSKLREKKVDGVMYKSGKLDQLLEAISTVIDGKQYFCQKFRKTLSQLVVQNTVPSEREIIVLKHIAHGFSTKDISKSLYISENTVENHRKSLFRKLKAHNMADLIMKAIAAGYIDPEEIKNNL